MTLTHFGDALRVAAHVLLGGGSQLWRVAGVGRALCLGAVLCEALDVPGVVGGRWEYGLDSLKFCLAEDR